MDFGSAIREARTSKGLSQREMAGLAKASLNSIYLLERGKGSVDLLERATAALDLRFAGMGSAATFADRIAHLRKRRGWSRLKLAERAGVSEPAIIRAEQGRVYISTLEAILQVLAPNARVRKDEVSRWHGGKRDSWFTPPAILQKIESVVGPIGLDPASHPDSNVVAKQKYFAEEDGLSRPWIGNTVFCNPPYSRATDFIFHAFECWRRGDFEVGVLLLPVYTHNVVWHEAVAGQADVFFLRGRVSFSGPNEKKKHAPFGNQIVIYGATDAMIDEMLTQFPCVHLPRSARRGVDQQRSFGSSHAA